MDDLHCTERFLALDGRAHDAPVPATRAPVTEAGAAQEGAPETPEATNEPPRGEPAARVPGKKEGQQRRRAAPRHPTETDGVPTLF